LITLDNVKSNYAYDRIKEYRDIGIDCLVIWEDEFNLKKFTNLKIEDLEKLKQKVNNFINKE
jgi:hypothetical protein